MKTQIYTILILLLLSFFYSPIAKSEDTTINGDPIPTDPKFEIHIVEVENLKSDNPKINTPSARLKVKEIIRTNIDKSYWDKLFRNSGYKNTIIIGNWVNDLGHIDNSQLLNLEGQKIIIYAQRVEDNGDFTFQIYKYFPYSAENRKAILNVLNPVSRIYKTFSPIIFLVLLLFAGLKVSFYFAPSFKKGTLKEQFVMVLPYLLILEFVLYLIYENSMPEEYNIRLDLMFIYPILLCSTIFSILLVHRQSKKEPETNNLKF